MLYLKKFKNFKIFLRGEPVEQFNIADELKCKEVVIYRPHVSSMKEVIFSLFYNDFKSAFTKITL